MTLSDPALSPHYIIANCFLLQRADAVNGYKSRYITRQSSINNASLVTNNTRVREDISAVPTAFRCQLVVEAENLLSIIYCPGSNCQLSLQPSWQSAFSAFSAAAGGCLCTRQEQTLAPPLVGETQRPPACVWLLSALVEFLDLVLIGILPLHRDTTLS